MKRYINWKVLVLLLVLGGIGLSFGLLSDGDDAPPSLSQQSSSDHKENQSPREAAERAKRAHDETIGALPEGVTRRADWIDASDEQRQKMARESKSPHHLDQGMEWGYFDADGNWVKVNEPGTLASDGYFYDSKGRRIVARTAAATESVGDGSGDRSADPKYDAIYLLVKSDEGPLENATVNLSSGDTTLFTQSTNREGLTKFAPLSGEVSQEITFTMSLANYKAEPVTRTLAPGAGTKVELLAEPDWTISGVVLDEQEVPLAGVRVDVTNDFGASIGDFRTGVDGAFRFANLEELFYDLAIYRADYQTEFVHRHTMPGSQLRIVMKRAVYVSGQIKDQDGNPIEHVRVESRHEPELQEAFVATTFSDAEGKYRVDAVAGAERMKMIFARAGYSSKTEYPVMADTTGLDVVLNKTDEATVSGILQFADGTYPKSSVTEIGNRTNSNTYQNGDVHRFEVSFLPSEGNSDKLSIYSNEFKPQEIDLGTLAKGDQKDLGTIIVEAGNRLTGRVFERLEDGSKKPIEGAYVISFFESDWSSVETPYSTNEHGEFEIPFSPATQSDSQVRIRADFKGYDEGSVDVSLPTSSTINIELKKANKDQYLFVQVIDHKTREPVSGVEVEIPSSGSRTDWLPQLSNSQGNVFCSGDASESTSPYILSQDSSVWENAKRTLQPRYHAVTIPTSKTYPTKDEAEKYPVVLEIEQAAALGVKYLDVFDFAASDIVVRAAVPPEDGTRSMVSIITQGDWEILDKTLPLGDYFVSSKMLRVFPRKVVLSDYTPRLYTLPDIATIKASGTIRDGNGQPHANRGFYVFRSKGSGVFETGFTDSQGRYEISNLWPGDFHLAIAKDNAEQAAQYFRKITVTSGKQEQSHDISLPAASVTINGVVKYVDGTPVSGATVSMTDRSVTLARGVLAGYVRTDDSGKFTAKHIEEFANIDIRVGGYHDEAETRLTFKSITTGGSNTVNEVEIIVERKGASGTVGYQAGNDVVFEPSDVSAIATDSQGRKVGNFFNGQFVDLAPGTYTYQFYAAGYLATPVTITVSESLQTSISGKATWTYDPDWPSPEG